jgi:hypothetical protein
LENKGNYLPTLTPQSLSRWERGEISDEIVVFGIKIRFLYPFPSPFGTCILKGERGGVRGGSYK